MGLLTPGYFPSTYLAKDYFTDDYWPEYAFVSGTIIEVFMFRDSGAPKTGLNPIIDLFIKVSDGTNVIPVPAVLELSGGYYKFYHNVVQDTIVRVDSTDGAMAAGERYLDIGVITPYDDLLNPPGLADAVWDEDLTTHTTAKSAGWFVRKIKQIVDTILGLVA